MAHQIRRAPARGIRYAIAAGVLLAAVPVAFGAVAQTLSDPSPSAKWSPPPRKAAKSPQAAHAKACGAYGPGFVNVPGTDTCVKIGGWVTVEGSARR
jgi:Porin subfamily